MTYKNVFVGGTFDRIHKGHEALFKRALEVGEHMTIGLTSDYFVNNIKNQISLSPTGPPAQRAGSKLTQPYETRKTALINFLDSRRWLERSSIIPIDDPFEPAASSRDYDAIIVTAHNKTRGLEINAKRQEKGLDNLVLLEVPLVQAQDGLPVSSTRVRSGEVDRQGKLVMPERLRDQLSHPFGTLLVGSQIEAALKRHVNDPVIAVGDVTTKTFLDFGIQPVLVVIDLLAEREPYEESKKVLKIPGVRGVRIQSGPGFISQDALVVIGRWKKSYDPKQSTVILVDGEEDLLALPVMQKAPINSIVYYGQPGKGLVEVEITLRVQQTASKLLQQFLLQ